MASTNDGDFPAPTWSSHRRSDTKHLATATEAYHGYNMESEPLAAVATRTTFPWRPFYLRRSVLISFALVFVVILVAIEVLVSVSSQHNGIASASSNQHYLWTFGPTAVLTLVAALWNRVDYQSKVIAPWIRLSQQGVPASRTLLLDYFSGLQYFVPFVACRNRDFATAATACVALIVKIMIIVSTGLLTLSWTSVDYPSDSFVLLDRFVNNRTNLDRAGSLSYYIVRGLIAGNLTYPDGMSKDYAFQSVQANAAENAELRLAVDGFYASLDCEPVGLVMTGSEVTSGHQTNTMNVTLTSSGCNVKLVQLPGVPAGDCHTDPDSPGGEGHICEPMDVTRIAVVQCDGTEDDAGKRILAMYANYTTYEDLSVNTTDYTGHPSHPWPGKMSRSTQILCTPQHTTVKLDIVRNGTDVRDITESTGTPNITLDAVSGWDIFAAVQASYNNSIESSQGLIWGQHSFVVGNTSVNADGYMMSSIFTQLAPNTSTLRLYDEDFLQEVVTGYYRQHAAIIAKQSLMESAAIAATGSVLVNQDRLVVRNWAAQWMAGMVIACLALTLFLAFHVSAQGILPCSPTTMLGTASLILHSHDLTSRLRGLGAADIEVHEQVLRDSRFSSGIVQDQETYQMQFGILDSQGELDSKNRGLSQVVSKPRQPTLLHPVSRGVLCHVLVVLIIALELLLHKSTVEDGLGDVADDTYIHYTWTTIPALVFGLLAMAFSSMDFRVRALAPYSTLKRTASPEVFTTLDFLDMSLPRTIIKEIQLANFGACAATLVFLVASMFTTFTSSLFQPLSIPTSEAVTLLPNQSFMLQPGLTAGEDMDEQPNILSSLILTSNLSYPQWTFENLAFAQYVPTVSLPSSSGFNASTASVAAVLPAVREKLDCRLYDSTEITYNLTRHYEFFYGEYQNPLGISVKGEECGLTTNSSLEKFERLRYNLLLSTYENATYFGRGGGTSGASDNQGCSDLLYTWGKFDWEADKAIEHIAVMGCNMSYEVVDVDITFRGLSLDLDVQNPPRPREDTARPSIMEKSDIGLWSLEYGLAWVQLGTELLDEFFGFLVSSPWAIPLRELGNASAENAIRDAIKFQHGIILAQNLGMNRVPLNCKGSYSCRNSTLGDSDADARHVYNATATDRLGRRRVVQDPVSTRVLEALLGITLVLLLASWVLMRDTAILPSSPTTIASVAALIAGGNILSKLPSNAAWMSPEQIAASFPPATRIWLGWGHVPDETGQNENGLSQFGIYAVNEGDGTESSWNDGKQVDQYTKVEAFEDEQGTSGARAPFFAGLLQRFRGYERGSQG